MNYYNENDPRAAAWLRELIAENLIPDGKIDTRSIADVRPDELNGFIQCHFFAGIGGWSYALRIIGWPEDKPVWTGSCPCQPLSCAGQRKGHADERHLWPAFYRLIAECRPPVVFGEQVARTDGREWFSGVRADLEDAGYACGCADLCAAGVGSPHPRQRLYWVANSVRIGFDRANESIATIQNKDRENGGVSIGIGCVSRVGDSDGARSQSRRQTAAPYRHGHTPESAGGIGGMDNAKCIQEHASTTGRFHSMSSSASAWSDYDICHFTGPDAGKTRRIEPGTFPLAHGFPERMGLLRGYGNAIVPQVAAEFIGAFMSAAPERP